jgi:hypothetical protein
MASTLPLIHWTSARSVSSSLCENYTNLASLALLAHRVIDVDLAIARDTGYGIESGELSYDPLDRSELSGATRDVPDACASKFPRRGGLNNVYVSDKELIAVLHHK